MKRITIALSILILIQFACKKDKDPVEPEQQPGQTVTISGKAYPTVEIGTLIWTSSNYDGPGGIPYDASNSKPEYGRYYTAPEISQVQLPQGWRIPTVNDYVKLMESQGIVLENYHATNQPNIKKLVSATRWKNTQGTNASGFNAFPAGYSFNNSSPMDGDISEFWTSEAITVSIQEGANLNHRVAFYGNQNNPSYRHNLRFVRDK
ncbi:FISUMP domain-containing protein [Pedobacter sp. SYSU D00535]|uniref:FISUMP domain-containing protein n=1 Tax=Pedobacter sp. SYSU D00535 TaxID=2810308 RepID=UPI001A95C3B5|nr:FISUMP domain-containing protein [Pedobacter sp. SYSU D00535]